MKAVDVPIQLPTAPPVLLSDGLRLRAYTDADAQLVSQVVSDPLIPAITTVPTTDDPRLIAEYIARQHSRLATGQGMQMVVAERDSDRAVGQAGLSVQGHGRLSVGYWIAPAHRRKGYAAAALALLSDWALTLPGLGRLELYVEPWNQGSWRAAEAAGFEREGLLRAWETVGQTRVDMFMYSRLP